MSNAQNLSYFFHSQLNILFSLLKIVMVGFILSSCSAKPDIDFDKQQAFLTQFVSGMSKQEVDLILQEHQDITLLSEEIQENGELKIRYSAPGDIYGTNLFTFRYSADLELIYVIPKNPTD